MFSSRVSPQKRKYCEYFDPDYVRPKCPIKKLCIVGDNSTGSEKFYTNTRLKRVSEIFSRELQKEITIKHEQLAEVECRLEHGRSLLDRLRFVIVAEYYRKQELSIAAGDITAVRGKATLFENEVNGLQKAQHPSLKTRVGKRPTKIPEDMGRPLPERVAAKNALNTIRARSLTQRRQERRLQEVIREQGLVIDHSKEANGQVAEAMATLSQIKTQFQNSRGAHEAISSKNSDTSSNKSLISRSSKALNATRLNNKTKQVIVIGNTSTYICTDAANGIDHKSAVCTHKWLVYVQSKNLCTPIESFIRKVRFHLHPSFRPNDIMDVKTPPFQIARRGWGEFPMRIQLFFYEHLHQKPIQLIHNLALDRTLSGIHTLGAETLMEIWLRSDVAIKEYETQLTPDIKDIYEDTNESNSKDNNTTTNSASLGKLSNATDLIATAPENTPKQNRTISINQNEEKLDDNLFVLRNKNHTIPDDITKLQSLVVKEPFENISASSLIEIISNRSQMLKNSPELDIMTKNVSSAENLQQPVYSLRSPLGKNMNQKDPSESSTITKTIIECNNIASAQLSNPLYTKIAAKILTAPRALESKEVDKALISNKSMQLTSPMIMRLPTSNLASSHSITNNSKNKNNIIALSRVGKLMPIKIANVDKMIAPNASYPSISVPITNTPEKSFLQKKLVQLKDAEGKIKFMQVLVATTQNPQNCTSNANESFGNRKSEAVVSVRNTGSTLPAYTGAAPFTKFSTTITDNDASKKIANCTTVHVLSTTKGNNQIQLRSSISNDRTVSSPKQMVFQKEGKLFVIDPLRMKLKQERRKQVSLLKPKTSLPVQSQQQVHDQKRESKSFGIKISDHDYTPSLNVKDCNATKFQTPLIQMPDLYLGIRRPRAKASSAFELLQQRRIQLEKDFLYQNIQSMHSAVDYILRRLPLIASKYTMAAGFSFGNHSLDEFDALPVMKQRACEWLRAKYVTRFLHSHKHLQRLNSSDKERFWSTREVLVYARLHAFTPRMKTFNVAYYLLQPQPRIVTSRAKPPQSLRSSPLYKSQHDNDAARGQEFSKFIKNEVKFQQEVFQYESISYNYHIASWLDGAWQKCMISEASTEFNNEPIDIVSLLVSENYGKILNANPQSKQPDSCKGEQNLYLPVPEHLEVSSQLVSDISRDFKIQLQLEPLEQDVILPLAQSVLARCLKMFVEKLIRRVVASKQSLKTEESLNITPEDIGKVLVRHAEFDFLTNKNCGTYKHDRAYNDRL